MPATSTAVTGPQSRPSLEGKTVVIADDDKIILDYLALRCRHLGLRVETASDGLRAVLKVSKERPDLLILDLTLPDVEGFEVVERLADPKFPPVPVIILTGRSDDAAKQRCEDLSVYYVHKGSETWADIEPLIYEILISRPVEPKAEAQQPAVMPRVLVVDDNPVILSALTQRLQKYQVNVIQASGGTQGFLLALRNKPDLIITDYNMEEGSGHYLLSRIKSSPSTQHIPVIVYTGTPLSKGEEFAVQRDLLGRGQAVAFVTKANDQTDLMAEIRKHIPLPG
ncbi:MAG: response regulator [Methyloceanibacter sp.]